MASLRMVLYGAIGVAIAMVAVERPVWAIGEPVTDVRVLDNQRTEESTVRSIAGINIGDTLQADTLDLVREHLNTSGLFADVNVWWEPHGAGVRINISVKDKFPWAPVPTASWSANNKSVGMVFVHGNLFGHGKQMLIGARYAQIDSGAAVAYRDPSLFGSWIYWQLQGLIQRQVIPEYDNYGANATLANPVEFRETRLWSYGFEPQIGIAWFRRVRTQVAWHRETYSYFNDGPYDAYGNISGSDLPSNPNTHLFPATRPGTVGIAKAGLTFDFRAREFAVMTGEALSGSVDYASPSFGSDFTFWRAGASWEQGIRFFRTHNLIYSAGGVVGNNLPFWNENTAGGTNLRGYLGQQFRGDSQLWGKIEYHFPLFSIGPLDFRALGFYDVSAIWFRNLPDATTGLQVSDSYQQYYQRLTPDGRSFPAFLQQGFSWDQSVHQDVGAGLRFFLRSVAVPLVGVDFGYGIESNHWNFIIVVGA